jgi:hypothetical protein
MRLLSLQEAYRLLVRNAKQPRVHVPSTACPRRGPVVCDTAGDTDLRTERLAHCKRPVASGPGDCELWRRTSSSS